MAQLVAQFAISYIVGRLTEPKAPRLGDLTGFKADYGGTVPLIFGAEARTDEGTVIWATDIEETVHKHKPGADYLFGLVGAFLPKRKTYTYSISLAVLLAGNPITRVRQILMNKKVVFDAGGSYALVFTRSDGTHKLFNTLRVYQGTMTQTPDPTMEAEEGMGEVPAYLGSAYAVIEDLELETFGNSVPSVIEFVLEEGTHRLSKIVRIMVAAAGVDLNFTSTGALSRTVRGLIISSPQSVSDAFTPLIQAYQFDAADQGGSLRFIPRGRYPKTTVTIGQLGGHQADNEPPERIRFTRAPEVQQPKEVTVNFIDPDRGYQPNSQTTQRAGGSAQSNINVNTGLTMTVEEAKRAADEITWEAWSGRQAATTTTDETRDDIQAAQVHAFQTPNGIDTFRVTRRTKGANNVINLELRADRPLIYNGTPQTGAGTTGGGGGGDPGGGTEPAPAPLPPATPDLPGVLNTPIFTEPPSNLGLGQLWISLSAQLVGGGHDPNFSGVYVYVATSNVDDNYRNAGVADAAAYMGELTSDLPAGGGNPDLVNTLQVDLSESGGVLASVSSADAAAAVNLSVIQDAGGTQELVSFKDAAATGSFLYDVDTLYRGLNGTTDALHLAGSAFAVLDAATFRFSLPADMIGVPLWFKFVQIGQSLADVAAWPYTPRGTGFGGGTDGKPTAPTGVSPVSVSTSGVQVNWNANPTTDNVTGYKIYRAPGLAAVFGAATQVGQSNGLSWNDMGALAGAAYTYFVVAYNGQGDSDPSAGASLTTVVGNFWGFGFSIDVLSFGLSAALVEYVSKVQWTLPAGMGSCAVQITADGSAPSAQTDFPLTAAGVQIGTIRFAAASRVATFIKAADTTYAPDVVAQIWTPANLNGMTGRLFGSIVGSRA